MRLDPGPAIVDAAGFSAARLQRLDDVFEKEISQNRLPGAVLRIERRGELVLNRAWGYTNRPRGTFMTPDAIFRIYSMTKPLVSILTLMLAAEGRLSLAQPVADFIPSFANLKVWTYGALVEPERPPTVHDLLRHTSGLIYARNGGAVGRLYEEANLFGSDVSNEEFADRIATLPLAHQPGRVWDYSHATDVLGRVVEVAAGASLATVLGKRLLEPLGMRDTGFCVPAANHARIAEALEGDALNEDGRVLFDPRMPRAFEAGGMGLVSTAEDYARFCRMLLRGGTDGRTTYLSPALLRFAVSDHVGPGTGIGRLPTSMLAPEYGFGLGFAVRLSRGGPAPGTPGEFTWSGIAGTYFWVDPEEDFFAILMTQAPRERFRYRHIVRTMVYDALVEAKTGKAKKKKRKKG